MLLASKDACAGSFDACAAIEQHMAATTTGFSMNTQREPEAAEGKKPPAGCGLWSDITKMIGFGHSKIRRDPGNTEFYGFHHYKKHIA